jgi:tRNA (guanine-N(7)-)-methyltransferase
MRQRKLRNLDTRYEAYADIIAGEPSEMRGRWSGLSGGAPLYVEIGCGKGKFISELAAREPEHFFVAIEGNKSVMMRAMEKIRQGGLKNVVFVPEHAGDLSEWFGDGEVDGIYLNFSDPLPKNYWYKRRLTYRDRLKSYFRVLKPEGTVTFKTDNTDLFNWSVLEIIASDLKILDITRDLHADPEANAANIETEYEAKYSGFGEKIKRVVVGRREAGGTEVTA